MPILWVSLTPPFLAPYKPVTRSRQALKRDAAALHAFVDKHKRNPRDLNLLRAFAYANKLEFNAYDAYGERIDYLPLDDSHFLLRSFGEDQVQNSLNSAPDMGVVNWGERPTEALTYVYPQAPMPGFYPVALLSGADSPDHQWLARVFSDQQNLARRLVVRHLNKEGLFMVAPHDGVEEFLWLPSGDRIVFTATGSTRYRDGLYLWDLKNDTAVNLLDSVRAAMAMSPAKNSANFWLSLGGISQNGPVLYAYVRPRHDGGLPPHEFFQQSSMLAITIPPTGNGQPHLANAEEFPASVDAVSITRPYEVRAHLAGQGTRIQQAWGQLPVSGEVEKLLLAWHHLSDKATTSPVYPYSLWLLSVFYGESAQLKTGSARDSEALRAYGSEIARALLNYPLAPSYLRGLAMYGYEELIEGSVLPYRLARFGSKSASSGDSALSK